MDMYAKCKPCPSCHKVGRVLVQEDDFYKWQQGMLIQEAFPYLTPDEREMLITGYDKKCWEDLFMFLEEDL